MESVKVTQKKNNTVTVKAAPAPAAAAAAAVAATAPAPAPADATAAAPKKAAAAKKTAVAAADAPVAPAPAAAAAAAAPAAPAAAAPKKGKAAAAVAAAAASVSVSAAPAASTIGTETEVATATVATATTVEPATASPHEELEVLANDLIRMAKRVLEVSRLARKEHVKQVKRADQGGKRRRAKTVGPDGEVSTHSNSVFLQPTQISPALATFCGVSPQTLLSRTDVTRKIAEYIKTNNLQNPENRREILADATLISLFALTSEDKLNYFNLQRYVKPHFIKEAKPEAAAKETIKVVV
jgi:chromatin remodeling complex protein RSC6